MASWFNGQMQLWGFCMEAASSCRLGTERLGVSQRLLTIFALYMVDFN